MYMGVHRPNMGLFNLAMYSIFKSLDTDIWFVVDTDILIIYCNCQARHMYAFSINLCNLRVLPTQMEKPSVKFQTPSQASTKSSGVESDLNESLNITRHRFLTAPEIPISDAEAKKRVSEVQLKVMNVGRRVKEKKRVRESK